MMLCMPLEDFKRYRNWIGQSPADILQGAILHGGWEKVFPRTEAFPEWASRVRNYFNVIPTRLRRLGDAREAKLVKNAQTVQLTESALRFLESSQKLRDQLNIKDAVEASKGLIAQLGALSGDVYEDNNGRLWYQMGAGAAVYHYEGKLLPPGKLKAIIDGTLGQDNVPVFKLVSPDHAGGSCELCVHNRNRPGSWAESLGTGGLPKGRRKEAIGEVGQWVKIKDDVVVHEVYKGSYNYSETIKTGLAAHDFRDIQPHKTRTNFYVDPPLMYSGLSSRRFPRKDRQGVDLIKVTAKPTTFWPTRSRAFSSGR